MICCVIWRNKDEESTMLDDQNEQLVMLHYFCFSYIGKDLETGRDCQGSTYVGYHDKLITKPMIDRNKELAGVTNEAVLIAVSYLGFMTKETMQCA